MSSKWFRESCYECPFAANERVADLTVGDFWNSERLPDSFGKNRRISVVLINSRKGEYLINCVDEKIEKTESSWDVAKKGNPNLIRSTRKYAGYREYSKMDSDIMQYGIQNKKKYYFNQLPLSVRRKLKRLSIKGL